VRGAVMASLLIVTVLAGCGSDTEDDGATEDAAEDPTSASPEPSEPTPRGTAKPERRGTVVTTAGSDYGTMLFDKSGQAIYLFDRESSERPRCYRGCAEAWPPVLTDGEPRATGRVKQRLLDTTERKDGTEQVTYAGHPLYYYAHEDKGEVLCHDVEEYGGVWLVVQPDGQPAP
jgi:predicted lipoprotein with Yx(FWY)xxD motif